MKKQLIIGGVTIILLTLGLSGCLDDGNKDTENGDNPESNIFIGRWKTTIYSFDRNGTRYDELPSNSTFYNNGTMGSESVEDDEIIWTPYSLENDQICFGEATASEYLCYDYEFSNNGTKVTLWTYVTDPYSEYGDTYELVVEMTKN